MNKPESHKWIISFLPIVLVLGFVLTAYNNCNSEMQGISNGSSTGGGGGLGGGGTIPPPGATYFAQRVRPVLNARCNGCHAEIFQGGTAPVTIYDYTRMKTLLSSGGTGKYQNSLMSKLTNTSPQSHAGGNVCASGLTVSPCSDIAGWWDAEFGGSGGSPPPVLAIRGGIDVESANGMIYGMAVDTARITDIVTVTIYADGAKGVGTLIATLNANQQQFDPNYPNHAFSFQLPPNLVDGRVHNLYAYGRTPSIPDILLKGTAFPSVAYPKSAAWETFFNANIRAACTSCHSFSSQQAYDMLANPLKAKGGTATTNDLIKTAANISTHSGGNRCGTVNQGVCVQMQNWWNQEFGSFP